MDRKFLIPAICLLALAGCNRVGYTGGGPAQAIMADERVSQQFIYSNFWSLSMPGDSVAPRYERARAFCLNDASLNCKLISATLTIADGSPYSATNGQLYLLLPHDKIELFEKALLQTVSGETNEDVKIDSRSLRADSVESELTDAGRRVTQLTAYRDRLATLAKRTNLRVEDIIRLEAETSRVQGELDAALKNKTSIEGRLARESLNISLTERPRGAIAGIIMRATDILVESTAGALEFLIRVVPWLPIIAAGLALAGWLWRRVRRLKAMPAG